MKRWFGCYEGSWKGVIGPAAFAHPAKFSKALVERILDYLLAMGWIEKGEIIGDPFGGVGCGGIVAAYRGFQWYGRELEPKFVVLGISNFRLHYAKWDRLGVPYPVMDCGDSRQFDKGFLAAARQHDRLSGVVASPPYVSGGHHTDAMEGGNRNGRGMQTKAIVTSPPYSGSLDDGGPETQHPDGYERSNNWTGYGKTEGQIGRLKAGEVDAVVSSPPFTGGRSGRGIVIEGHNDASRPSSKDIGKRTFQGSGAEREPDNIEVLATGKVAAVLTSPPYEVIHAGAGGLNTKPAKRAGQQSGRSKGVSQTTDQQYGEEPGQIARAKKGDVAAVLTSPPYEDSMNQSEHGIDFLKGKTHAKDHVTPKRLEARNRHASERRYGTAEGQIGASKGQTYWEAMKQVYEACFRALKPGGVMAIVVKDYVKDKKRVRLCDDTMSLLMHIGFIELERVAAMLVQETEHEDMFAGTVTTRKERKSFWRRLSEGKGSPRIDYEEVLFVRKPI